MDACAHNEVTGLTLNSIHSYMPDAELRIYTSWKLGPDVLTSWHRIV